MSTPQSKKMSAAEVRRRRALREQKAAAGPLPLLPQHEKALVEFVPRTVTAQEWVLIRPLLEAIMRRSGIIGAATFPQHLSDVTLYLAWALRQDHGLELSHVLDHRLIEEWARTDLAGLEATTRSTRRSRFAVLGQQAQRRTEGPTPGSAGAEVDGEAPVQHP